MFSFEGHYKKPRTINYSKETNVGKQDLIEKARIEREKRALLKNQITSAKIIQKAYRELLIKRKNRKIALAEYQSLINDLRNSNITSVDPSFLDLIIKIISKLLIFCNSSIMDDQSLKLLIDYLIKGDTVNRMINNQPERNYYNAVTFSLLLRVISRCLQSTTENSSYNHLRFFELFFSSLQSYDSRAIHLNLFHKCVLLILTDSDYFKNMSVFICCQMIPNGPVENYYKQMKISYVLKTILQPIVQSLSLGIRKSVIINYVNSVYRDSTTSNNEHILRQFKLMSMALLDVVEWHIIVDLIFCHYTSTGTQITPSVGLVYFLISIQPIVEKPPSPNTTKASAQILILFSHLSNLLISNNQLFLSNNLVNTPSDNAYIDTHNDFDFDMKEAQLQDDDSSDDEEEAPKHVPVIVKGKEMSMVEQEIASALKWKFPHVILPLAVLNDDPSIDDKLLTNAIGYVYHLLLLQTKLIGTSESKSFILKLIQATKTITRRLWICAVEQSSTELNKSVMDALIKREIRLSDSDLDLFFGKLLCFANCLHWRLLSVQDLDLISLSSDRCAEVLEFSSDELCTVVLKLRDIMCGLIFLIYPQSKTKLLSIGTEKLTKIFVELQRVVTRLYNRDVRKGLKMSGKRLDWVMPDVCRINVHNLKNFKHLLLDDYKFGQLSSDQLTQPDLRQFVILKEMPFIVPIGTRMKLFKEMIMSLDSAPSYHNRATARIRRGHVYEDGFNQITKKNVPNLKTHLKIEFIDRFGIDEAGIDGGGLLREFLSAIVLEACDPKRGLFINTTNNLLYPNPEIETVYPDNWQSHLYFIGRMIGLIIFKGLLVEVPFAPFFLQRLFSNKSTKEEIDIDNLQYLDDELYRNLLSMKSMDNVDDMSLDFTVSRHCYGLSKTVELKENGRDVVVTNDNKIEYIYLVADYKLNRQIATQSSSIIAGIADILPIECFQLFDLDEMSFIITGGGVGATIDIDDLRRNTVYHGLDDPARSDTINHFWQVVTQMSEEEKRSFIQFVTSLSRAPMLGFGELTPKFAIVLVSDTERLPTASTCLNLLKLPAYTTLEEMRQRLLYAIGSDTGFHLS